MHNNGQLTIDPTDGFNFDTKRKMQAIPKSFDYDLCLIYAVAGDTRKTARYDMDCTNFINSLVKKGNQRPQVVAIGIKGKDIVFVLDEPKHTGNNLMFSKMGMVSSKHKVAEIIKSQGLQIPEDEGDELRLYFKLHYMIGNMYRAELLQSPKVM